jgi:hypothetical protein
MSAESATALTELLDRLNSHAHGDEPGPPMTPAKARAMYLVASDVVEDQLGSIGTREVPADVLAGTGRMLAAALGEANDDQHGPLRVVGGRHRKHDWR